MIKNYIYNQVNQELKKAKKVLLCVHRQPDEDACGSALALFFYLVQLGCEVEIFAFDLPLAYLNYLPGIENISDDKQVFDKPWDIIVVLDTGDLTHAGLDESIFGGTKIINIDHHHTNTNFGYINAVDQRASSTCEIVYQFLTESGFYFDRRIATCLLFGIVGDTGGFSNGATTPKAIDVASKLITAGAKINKVVEVIFKNKSIDNLRLWGLLLSRLILVDSLDLVYTYIKEIDYKKVKVGDEAIDGFSNLLNIVADGKIAMFVKIKNNQTQVSLRTICDDVDVAKIAGHFGGGGHKKAAGFITDLKIDKILKEIKKITALEKK